MDQIEIGAVRKYLCKNIYHRMYIFDESVRSNQGAKTSPNILNLTGNLLKVMRGPRHLRILKKYQFGLR
jgi:hypothetical protein